MLKPYTKPVLYDAKGDLSKKWYVEFHYQHPGTGKRKRFKIYEGINSFKTKSERKEHASIIIKNTLQLLEDGYNPFSTVVEQEFTDVLNMKTAIEKYSALKKPVVRAKTLMGYESVLRQVEAYFVKKGKHLTELARITTSDIQGYFDHAKATRDTYANTTHNTELTVLRVFFAFWIDRGQCHANPARGVKRLRETPAQHQAYSEKESQSILNYLRTKDTPAHKQLLQFLQFVYYSCIRPNELRNLRVSHINLRDMTITVPGELAKSGRTESVQISPGLKTVIDEMNLADCPPHWYVFGNAGKGVPGDYFQPGPGEKPVGYNHFSGFYRQILTELGLPSTHTLYGWKHTRNIQLYKAGVDLYRIMRHNRHTNLSVTQKYLRNLGVFMDTKIDDDIIL